ARAPAARRHRRRDLRRPRPGCEHGGSAGLARAGRRRAGPPPPRRRAAARRREPRVRGVGTMLSVSVTERGRALAARLPFERVHGSAADTVRARWADVDAFVLFLATGAAVRIVAPLLRDKHTDP